MGLSLIKLESLFIYTDGRVFDWKDHGYYLTLNDYTVMNRSGEYWEVLYRMSDLNQCQRMTSGSREYCMKAVENQIRQDELT